MTHRRFDLIRNEDVTGVSGTGLVAEGVEFSDGTVVLRWCGANPTSVVWHDNGIESVQTIHGVRWCEEAIDAAHIERQRRFSAATFGPGLRLAGLLDHIRKELAEIEAAPDDLDEWADLIILAVDGAWRSGHEPQQIIDAVIGKQARNEARTWPDWRTVPDGLAIEHDRGSESRP